MAVYCHHFVADMVHVLELKKVAKPDIPGDKLRQSKDNYAPDNVRTGPKSPRLRGRSLRNQNDLCSVINE